MVVPTHAVVLPRQYSIKDSTVLILVAIAELPDKYREVLKLRYIQNLPLSVAAQRAGCSQNTFYQRVHIATNMLKTKLYSR